MNDLDEWKSFYEFNFIEKENSNEIDKITFRFESTEMTINTVLGKFENFLIASGFDWVEQGSLSLKNKNTKQTFHSTQFDLGDDFMESTQLNLSDALKDAFEDLKNEKRAEKNKEIGERMMGIDRTAKVVHIGGKFNKKENVKKDNDGIDNTICSISPQTISWNIENPKDAFEVTDFNITYGGIPISELDFSEKEYEVDEKDNIILETEEKE